MNTSDSNKTIIIADNQFLVISSLVNLIESGQIHTVSGIAESRQELYSILNSHSPDLLITDFHHIDYDGTEELLSILHTHSQLVILILVNQINSNEIARLARAGIKNIALKTDSRQDLLTSIEFALRKKKHFSDPVLDLILEHDVKDNTHSELTSSETEIVKLIADGHTTKEIAEKKHISTHTVMTHRKNIFRKLSVSSISELTKYAVRNGLTDVIDYNI